MVLFYHKHDYSIANMQEFYLSRTLQMLSAFFVCSMPIAILQSSSTQNDLVLSTFILLFYYYQLSGINSDSNLNIFLSGLALGLGVLTKGFVRILIFYRYSLSNMQILHNSLPKRIIIFKSVTIVFIGLIINVPHYLRTYFKYGDFLGLNINQIHANETFFAFHCFRIWFAT